MTDPGHPAVIDHATAPDSAVGSAAEDAAEDAAESRRDPDGVALDRAELAYQAARGRARRAWRWQLIVVGVILALVAAGIWQVWRHSEIRAVTLHTSSIAPTPLPSGPLPATLNPVWHTNAVAATGQPIWQDVVVVHSGRTVSGLDAYSGAVRWSYTRSDRALCDVAAQDGVAIAIYAHDGLCDEVTGLDMGSGRRRWVRTLLSAGTPTTLRVSSANGNLLLVTPASIELLQFSSSYDWWYADAAGGCSFRRAVLGSQGVLIQSQCLAGSTLSLRTIGSSKDPAWTNPLGGRQVLSADQLIVALNPDRASIDVFDAKSGNVTATVTLPAAVTAPDQPASFPAGTEFLTDVIAVQDGWMTLASSDVTGASATASAVRPGALPRLAGQSDLIAATDATITQFTTAGPVTSTSAATGVRLGDGVALLGRGALVMPATGTTAYR